VRLGLGFGGGLFFVAVDEDALGIFAGLAAFLFGHVAAVLHAAAGIALATGVRDDSVLIQPLGGLLLRFLRGTTDEQGRYNGEKSIPQSHV